jgi:ABC-type arginine transport system permease subunit
LKRAESAITPTRGATRRNLLLLIVPPQLLRHAIPGAKREPLTPEIER